MGGAQYALVIDVICAVSTAMVLLPVILYLCRAWATRRDKLFAYLDPLSLNLYYRQFYPATVPAAAVAQEQFRKDFGRHYGRRHYVVPLLLLGILAAITAYSGVRTIQVWQGVAPGKFKLPWIAASALAGGFAWVINDLVSRLRRRDFTVSDVYNSVFRILFAAPFGWAFAQLAKDAVGVPLAFLLGAFPTGTLFTIARRLAATRLGVSEDPDSGALELEKLQSITKTNAERFYDEGISTIVQLAYADPVDLTIRTKFDFNYVIDCISQALLWIYFEEKTRTLAVYSLRGAQEVSGLMRALADTAQQAQATATLNATAAALNLDANAVRTTLQQIAGDPYTEFICTVWH